MSVKYEAFLPHVLPFVPNCYDEQAIVAVRNACIDFCRGTLVLQQDIDPVSVVKGQSEYELESPAGYLVTQVQSLHYLDRPLSRKSQYELEKIYPYSWQTVDGSPSYFTQFNPDTFVLCPVPGESIADAVTGRVMLVPTRASTTVESVVYERYLDHIVDGALARLMMTPNEPYYDPQAARLHANIFASAMASVRAYVNGGMNHAPMRVRLQRTF